MDSRPVYDSACNQIGRLPSLKQQVQLGFTSDEASEPVGSMTATTGIPFARRDKVQCSLCGKSRSSRYYENYSEVRGQSLERNICSRPKCAKYKSTLRESYCCETILVEVHHYFHSTPSLKDSCTPANAAELPGESRFAKPAELPDASRYIPYSQKFTSGRVFSVIEGPPPLVNKSTKPELHF